MQNWSDSNEKIDPIYLIFMSVYSFGGLVRMEVTFLVLAAAVFYIIVLLLGGFNDILEHQTKASQARRKWQGQELKKK